MVHQMKLLHRPTSLSKSKKSLRKLKKLIVLPKITIKEETNLINSINIKPLERQE